MLRFSREIRRGPQFRVIMYIQIYGLNVSSITLVEE